MPSDHRTPRVSVILRTRNRPAMLRDALQDILAQTFADFEIVVVDDGDITGEVRRAVRASDDSRIRIIDRTSEAHSRALAANAGIRAASGEYLVIHDDDDGWKPEFLERTVSYLDAHPDAVAVSARTEVVIHRVDDAGEPAGEDRGLLNQGMDAITIPDMLRVNRITTNSLLYRARLHEEIGFIDETLAVLEDWDFYLRLLMRHPIELLPLPALAEWHHRPAATGDAGNSVYELGGDHKAADVRVRDNYIRQAFGSSAGGPGAGLLLVHESQLLDARVAHAQSVVTAAIHEAEVEIRVEIRDLIDAQTERLDAIVHHHVQYHSLAATVRRALMRLRRQRR